MQVCIYVMHAKVFIGVGMCSRTVTQVCARVKHYEGTRVQFSVSMCYCPSGLEKSPLAGMYVYHYVNVQVFLPCCSVPLWSWPVLADYHVRVMNSTCCQVYM